MAKYNHRLLEKAARMTEHDFTVTDISQTLNISRNTFYKWRRRKTEFNDALEKAIEYRYERYVLLYTKGNKVTI